jgi:transcriptional regulator with XRE-family HTH domain
MATPASEARVGPLLRDWRRRRRLSQLDLALDAGVSARHLSFVETGRSRPSAQMVLHLAERRLRGGDGDLAFVSTVATFGTAVDITVAELAIESFFPADAPTAEAVRRAAA